MQDNKLAPTPSPDHLRHELRTRWLNEEVERWVENAAPVFYLQQAYRTPNFTRSILLDTITFLMELIPRLVNARLYRYEGYLQNGCFRQVWRHRRTGRRLMDVVVGMEHSIEHDFGTVLSDPYRFHTGSLASDFEYELSTLIRQVLLKARSVQTLVGEPFPDTQYWQSCDEQSAQITSLTGGPGGYRLDVVKYTVDSAVARQFNRRDQWTAINPLWRESQFTEQEIVEGRNNIITGSIRPPVATAPPAEMHAV